MFRSIMWFQRMGSFFGIVQLFLSSEISVVYKLVVLIGRRPEQLLF